MTHYGPSSAFLLLGGKNVSADVWDITENVENVNEQSNGLGVTMQEFESVGIAKAAFEAKGGFYTDDTLRVVAAIQSLQGTRQLMSYGMQGQTMGADVNLIDGTFATKFNRIAQREALTKANADYVLSGKLYRGSLLHALSAETTAGNNEATSFDGLNLPDLPSISISATSEADPTEITTATAHGLITGDIVVIVDDDSTPSLDGSHTVTVTGTLTFTVPVEVTAAGSAGSFKKVTQTNAIAQLHVPALTLGGYTNLVVKVRHSHDNITFADAGTFAAITAAGTAASITITGQIRRYRAMSWAWTGAGSGQTAIPYVALSNN